MPNWPLRMALVVLAAQARLLARGRMAWLGLVLTISSATGFAADLLEEIAAGLDPAPVIVSEFTQIRKIAALKQPVVSHGRVVFARGRGVIWQIERPYRYTYVLGSRKIAEIKANGERLEREPREVPGMAQASRVFEALLRADLSFLREQFHSELKGSRQAWVAELLPREAAAAGVVGRLVLKGGRQVNEIEFVETNGDSTVIRLRHSSSTQQLGAADAALFP